MVWDNLGDRPRTGRGRMQESRREMFKSESKLNVFTRSLSSLTPSSPEFRTQNKPLISPLRETGIAKPRFRSMFHRSSRWLILTLILVLDLRRKSNSFVGPCICMYHESRISELVSNSAQPKDDSTISFPHWLLGS